MAMAVAGIGKGPSACSLRSTGLPQKKGRPFTHTASGDYEEMSRGVVLVAVVWCSGLTRRLSTAEESLSISEMEWQEHADSRWR